MPQMVPSEQFLFRLSELYYLYYYYLVLKRCFVLFWLTKWPCFVGFTFGKKIRVLKDWPQDKFGWSDHKLKVTLSVSNHSAYFPISRKEITLCEKYGKLRDSQSSLWSLKDPCCWQKREEGCENLKHPPIMVSCIICSGPLSASSLHI